MSGLLGLRSTLTARWQLRGRKDQLAFLLRLREEYGAGAGGPADRAVRDALVLGRSLSECGRKLRLPGAERRQAFLRLVQTTPSRARHRTGFESWLIKLAAGLAGLSLFGAIAAAAGAEFELGGFELPLGVVSRMSSGSEERPEPEDQKFEPTTSDISTEPAEIEGQIDAVLELLSTSDDADPVVKDERQPAGASPEVGIIPSAVAATSSSNEAAPLPATVETDAGGQDAQGATQAPEPKPGAVAFTWFPGQGNSAGPPARSEASPAGPPPHASYRAGDPAGLDARTAAPAQHASAPVLTAFSSATSPEPSPGDNLPRDAEARQPAEQALRGQAANHARDADDEGTMST